MSFPRYPAYKDSGVEWLGEVPEHWEVTQLKWQILRNDGGVWGVDPDSESPDTIVLRSTEQTVDGKWQLDEPATRRLSLSEKASSLLAKDDLLITKSSGSSAHIGKTTIVTDEIADLNCCYSNFMQRLRLGQGLSPTLAWYALNNRLIREQFDFLSNSTTGLANLNGSMIGQVLIPLAPRTEQDAIATFLDCETTKIDALIAEQQRLIDLLQEKRQAVISHAVTKGLNPDAPMKDSGVEWLGEVPMHWEVRPIKYLCDIYSGFPFKSDLFQADGMPVVRMSNISGGCINLKDAACVPEHEVPAEALIRAGDLLLGLSGSVGNFGIATEDDLPAAVNQRVALIRTSHPILKHFLGSSLFSDQVTCGLPSTTIANVSASQLGNCLLAVPPSDEQEQIEAFLSDFVSGSTELMSSIEASLSLLQERRSTLISAAVTGQIDVRGLVPEAKAG
jgi:type I restriction enzyme S subunit